jgi:hypothetical protein
MSQLLGAAAVVRMPSVFASRSAATTVVKTGKGAAQLAKVPRITFGHPARHLEGTGLSADKVESTILEHVTTAVTHSANETGSFWGRVNISGTTIEYRAYTLPDGTINVGTYYVP